jgi:hypothetical protein
VPGVARILVLSAVLALGACAMPDFDSFRSPDAATIFRPLSVTNLSEKTLPPVAAADMVDSEGGCAGAMASLSASDGGAPADQGGAPGMALTGAIALDMTECDVVKRAGAPERVELGTNARNERTAVLTFIRGARPGIYHFTAGRLTSMERAPEPPAPPRPARPQKRASTPGPAQTAGR